MGLSVSENYVKICRFVDLGLNFCNTNDNICHPKHKETDYYRKIILQKSNKANDYNVFKVLHMEKIINTQNLSIKLESIDTKT